MRCLNIDPACSFEVFPPTVSFENNFILKQLQLQLKNISFEKKKKIRVDPPRLICPSQSPFSLASKTKIWGIMKKGNDFGH